MSDLTSYHHNEAIAVITLDDGKVNALSPAMQQSIHDGLDSADRDDAKAVVITGNAKVFSGGFDLTVLAAADQTSLDMLKGGFELAHRLLSYPKPVVAALSGPAVAMGAFLMASCDHRIAAPAYRIQANEVAIGLTMPRSAMEIMKLRLTPSAFQQAMNLAKPFFGENAVAAGWLDEIVLPDVVLSRAEQVAREAANLNAAAHAATKLLARADALAGIQAGIDELQVKFAR